MKIDVHSAEISTVAVSIKTLTVSGKQVTLAVFRQLQNEPLILPGPVLAGVPWGTVNYFPPPCEANHLHVVWQQGEELRRSCVYNEMPHSHVRIAREPLEEMVNDLFLHDLLNRLGVCRPNITSRSHSYSSDEAQKHTLELGYNSPVGVIHGLLDTTTAHRLIKLYEDLLDIRAKPTSASYIYQLSSRMEKKVREDRKLSYDDFRAQGVAHECEQQAFKLAPKLCQEELDEARRKTIEEHGEADPDIVSQWQSEIKSIQQQKKDYAGLVAVLRSLPQLFIAV